MLFGYWRVRNEGDIARMEASFAHDKYWLAFAKSQAKTFFTNAACARAWGDACAFE